MHQDMQPNLGLAGTTGDVYDVCMARSVLSAPDAVMHCLEVMVQKAHAIAACHGVTLDKRRAAVLVGQGTIRVQLTLG